MNETQDETLARLVRIECKLSALMEALGYDTYGVPLKKQPHPDSLFKPRTVLHHSQGYLTRN